MAGYVALLQDARAYDDVIISMRGDVEAARLARLSKPRTDA